MTSKTYTRDHPLFFHALLGASPWWPAGARTAARYYINHYHYRGWEWWDTTLLADKKAWIAKWGEFFPGLTDEHLGYGMPEGYWDVEQQRWFKSHTSRLGPWTDDFYDAYMRKALQRRTLAPTYAPKEVLTANGSIVEKGMLCRLLGGSVLNRPNFDLTPNIGMTVLVMWRHACWHFKESGLRKSYGSCGVTLREYADCRSPYAWWIKPAQEGEVFVIPGRNFDAQWTQLPIEDPKVSLFALDDSGSRALRCILPTPEKEVAWP